MEGNQHLSPIMLRAMIDGVVHPHRTDVEHLENCDECSDLWWRIKQQAKLEKSREVSFDEKQAA